MKRPLYIERAGWVGFGRASAQLDLFESTWRVGWWRVSFCRTCLITRIQETRDTINEAIRQIEQRHRERDGR